MEQKSRKGEARRCSEAARTKARRRGEHRIRCVSGCTPHHHTGGSGANHCRKSRSVNSPWATTRTHHVAVLSHAVHDKLLHCTMPPPFVQHDLPRSRSERPGTLHCTQTKGQSKTAQLHGFPERAIFSAAFSFGVLSSRAFRRVRLIFRVSKTAILVFEF
jgi:hypothetical protein